MISFPSQGCLGGQYFWTQTNKDMQNDTHTEPLFTQPTQEKTFLTFYAFLFWDSMLFCLLIILSKHICSNNIGYVINNSSIHAKDL